MALFGTYLTLSNEEIIAKKGNQSKQEKDIVNNRVSVSPPPPIITYELGEALISAAASNSVTKLESLLNQDIDVNFRDTLYGITALHAAVQNRHVQAVKILLEHGARKDIVSNRGLTPIESNQEFFNLEIYDLLNPELALIRHLKLERLEAIKSDYLRNHHITLEKQAIYDLANQYLKGEDLKSILTIDKALECIINAVQYITLDLWKAEEYNINHDSDGRWSSNDVARSKFNTIAACVFYLRENHPEILAKLPGIDWNSFSLLKHSQHNGYHHQTILKSLQKMLASGELEWLEYNIKQIRNNEQTTNYYSSRHLIDLLNVLGNDYKEEELRIKYESSKEVSLIRAAANNNVVELELLLNQGIDINFQDKTWGITALHAAVQNRHVEAVRFLLEHGASKDIVNNKGLTPVDINREFDNLGIYDLLNPQLATVRQSQLTAMENSILKYSNDHPPIPDVTREMLIALASQYLNSERITDDLDSARALKYIINAIQYLTLELLEAEKCTINHDSDGRWNHDSLAEQMLKVISACAFCLRKNHSSDLGNLPGINWEALSLYIRESQYNPNFLSDVGITCRRQLVHECLHSMLNSGELEELRNSIEQVFSNKQATNYSPVRFSALLGFLSDEYNAQYIENGIKNYRNHGNLESSAGRVRLLISFVEIGEALENSSPRLQSLFDRNAIEHLSIIRNAIAHPERIGNREMINNFLDGKSPIIKIGDIIINLQELSVYCINRYDDVSKFLGQYNRLPGANQLWHGIESHAGDYTVASKHKMPRSSHETELSKISGICHDELARLKQNFVDRKKVLDEEITEWFKSNRFDREVGKNHISALNQARKALDDNRADYENSKAKNESERNAKDKKLVKDFENVILKFEKWQYYCQELEKITQDNDVQREQTEQHKNKEINRFAIELLNDFLNYSTQVKSLFAKLNDFQYVITTSTHDTARGFSGHQDHPILAFYQIMIGSISRTLLTINSIKEIMPPELQSTLNNIVIVARGYLAHIGVREAGQPFSESIDRGTVFFTNSTQIIESIQSIATIKFALEHHISYAEASSALLLPLQTDLHTEPKDKSDPVQVDAFKDQFFAKILLRQQQEYADAQLPASGVSLDLTYSKDSINWPWIPLSDSELDKVNNAQPTSHGVLWVNPDGDCMYNSALAGIRRLPEYEGNRMMSLAELRGRVTQIINDNIGQYFDQLNIQIFEAIRDGDLRGFRDEILESIKDLGEQRKALVGTDRDELDQNIRDFIAQQGVVQQYIEMIQSRAAWGGAVELGIMSEILEVQLVVHRRGGTIDPPINNTGNAIAPIVDLDYNGGHYNLILNPGMEMEHFGVVSSLPKIDHEATTAIEEGTPINLQDNVPRELESDSLVVVFHQEDKPVEIVGGILPEEG